MRTKNLLFLLCVLLTAGLIAAGCGDDDSDSTTTASETTATETTTSETEDTSTTEETTSDDESSSGSGEVDSEGVYEACLDAVEGTPAASTAETACAQARDAFEQCAEQAESLPEDNSAREDAIAICREAAEQAIQSLEATG